MSDFGTLEKELIDGLATLASGAPDAPLPGGMGRRLRRRKIRRVGRTLVACACLALGLSVAWHTAARSSEAAPAPTVARTPDIGSVHGTVTESSTCNKAKEEAPPPMPLSFDSTSDEVEDAIRSYLDSINAANAMVTKRPGDGIFITLSGPVEVSTERLERDFGALLAEFDAASLSARADSVRYSFMGEVTN